MQIDQAQKKLEAHQIFGVEGNGLFTSKEYNEIATQMAYQYALVNIVRDASDRMSDTEKLTILHLTGSEYYLARKTIIQSMVEAGNVDLNRELKEAVVDPFIDPICHDDIEFATYLLEHGVQPNAISKTLAEGNEKFAVLFKNRSVPFA